MIQLSEEELFRGGHEAVGAEAYVVAGCVRGVV